MAYSTTIGEGSPFESACSLLWHSFGTIWFYYWWSPTRLHRTSPRPDRYVTRDRSLQKQRKQVANSKADRPSDQMLTYAAASAYGVITVSTW
jgi:hypothetical protein